MLYMIFGQGLQHMAQNLVHGDHFFLGYKFCWCSFKIKVDGFQTKIKKMTSKCSYNCKSPQGKRVCCPYHLFILKKDCFQIFKFHFFQDESWVTVILKTSKVITCCSGSLFEPVIAYWPLVGSWLNNKYELSTKGKKTVGSQKGNQWKHERKSAKHLYYL